MLLKKSAVAFLALFLLSGCNSTKKHSGMGHGTECSMLSEFEKNVGDKVYFAFNKSDLSHHAKEQLNKQACWLKKHCHVKATIEGHCDTRGTREYNLALGERRAESVKHYLHSQGIESNRIDTISYGKERPTGHGHDKDRRAVTKVK